MVNSMGKFHIQITVIFIRVHPSCYENLLGLIKILNYFLLHSRVMSGIFGQIAKFGQRPFLLHISNIGIKNELTKQT